MNTERQIEEMANDINKHCCSLAEQFCGETSCNACLTNFLCNEGYRKQEWISVEERLPNLDPYGKGRYGGKRSVRVLCACKQKDGRAFVKEGYYEPYGDGFAHWRIPGSIDSVTHWMPLPTPPKLKGE